MAPVTVDPKKTRTFRNGAELERWMKSAHARENELWIKFHKKGSGLVTITYAEALDVALCWGWIDGIRKSFDAQSFLQRFTPRRPRSVWSQVNREHVARLTAAGRMTPHGQRHVDAAVADGRWAAAYAPIRLASADAIPEDLKRAIMANARARETFAGLTRTNLFALAYRANAMKTAAGRARKIVQLVEMLARGETIAPQATTTAGAARKTTTPGRKPEVRR